MSTEQRIALSGEGITDEEIVLDESVTLKRKTTGRPAVLRGTQVYPKGYGDSVCKCWAAWRASQNDWLSDNSSESDYEEHTADWEDARLQEVVDVIAPLFPTCPRVW